MTQSISRATPEEGTTVHLAIVGSQDLTDPQREAVDLLVCGIIHEYAYRLGHRSVIVVSGGAEGVDSIAEGAARSLLYYEPEIHYPKNRRWGPDGFKDRNIIIAERCHQLVCIRSRQSTTYGSGWTSDYAEQLGKRVFRYFV